MSHQLVTRRRFLYAAAIASAGIGLAACGGTVAGTASSSGSSVTPSAAATTSGPTTQASRTTASTATASGSMAATAPAQASGQTEMWASWGAGSVVQKGYEAGLAALNQHDPAVHAAYSVTSPWPNKFLTAMAGGVPPDVIACGVGQAQQVIAWAYKGLLTPLDSYVTADKVAEKDFYGPAWRENYWTGKNYALPLEVDPNFPLIYNKTLFSQVGLDPAKPPTTIAEFDAANQKLLAKTGDAITRMGTTAPWHVSSDANSLLTWFTVFGGGFLDPQSHKLNVTTPQNAATLDWLASYARAYGFDAVTAFTKGFDKNGAIGALAQGKIAMLPFVSANFQELADLTKTGATRLDEFAFGYLPTATAGQANKGWLGGWALGQPHGAPHPDKSWDVIKWMTASPQGTDAWASVNGFLPAYRPSPFLARVANQFGFDWYLKVLDAAQSTPPGIAGWGDIPAANFHSLLYDPIQGKVTSQDALASFQRVVSAFLGTYK